ncbi:hypothetical protein [Rickettsia sibirica]|uniref:Uncharacterized protein n=2 Tax=spotted fever group TaxID=114277 RepID=Q7P9F5_RICS2|nr:hypothetical protein [Rickettsia sibirica]EAA26236.1 hypothetical protein rsib_orf1065 [Rickettsia sibirica 246]
MTYKKLALYIKKFFIMKLKDLFIKYPITTPFLVDCKNDKLVFPSDKEQKYKRDLKEKIGEEECEKLTALDKIV